MRRRVPLLLAHEMQGVGGQEARGGVPFSHFFASESTPIALIKVYCTLRITVRFTVLCGLL